MRGFALVLCLVATTAAAQQPVPAVPQSTPAESVPPPAPPTPEQLRYLEGLRTAGRGIAQLKDGVSRVSNSQGDSLRLKQAARRLGGLCGAASGFMSSGRARMRPTAYEDSTRVVAQRLTLQVDSLVRSMPGCQRGAATSPDSTVAALLARLRVYETALRDFRAAIGLPNR